MSRVSHVVVLGGGPAGLAAAAEAAHRGATVTVVEAADQLGGQYWRRLHHAPAPYPDLDPAIDVRTETSVWAVESHDDGLTVHTVTGPADGSKRERHSLRADAFILATGAYDRVLPFPGWDLPGVFTAGGAQTLAKGDGVCVGRQTIVAGSGPFLLPVAAAVSGAGSRVLGVYEASSASRLVAGWLARPWELLATLGKAGELTGYVAGQLKHHIPYYTGIGVVAAHGTDRLTSVTTARLDAEWSPIPGSERTVAADALCVGHGFTPRSDLAVAAGCAVDRDSFVIVAADQQTSVPGVYAAGEVTGIGGIDAARREGAMAGHCAAGGDLHDPALARTRRSRTNFARFAARLATAHRIGRGWTDWVTDDTIVCRCEDVTAGTLRDIHRRTDSVGLRSVRLTTRAELGPCQGRICGAAVIDLLSANARGLTPDGPSRRPIAVPLRLGELAGPLAPDLNAPHPHQNTFTERNPRPS